MTIAGAPPTPLALSMHTVMDGECSTGTSVAALSTNSFTTGNWAPGTAFTAGAVDLSQGKHVLTVCFETVYWASFFGISLTATAAGTGTPFNNLRQPVPGFVKAAFFDAGGEGRAYHKVATPSTFLRTGQSC